MPTSEQDFAWGHPSPPDFCTTQWSNVLRAGKPSAAQAIALEQLCAAYWYPIYAFVRKRGYDAHEAQDLTQEFFSRLLKDGSFRAVHPSKGRFRSFLLACLRHFLANEWNRAQRQKRGGGAIVFSLDEEEAEHRYHLEPIDERSPESIFDRRWAEAVLGQVINRLRAEVDGDGAPRFDELKAFLLYDNEAGSHAQTAARLGLSESAVKSAIYRMRQRYAELFRQEIAKTVADPSEIDEEIRYLFTALKN
jgi:RNA polymerase sigma-70 factor (ECF subfamily)